MRTKDLVEMPEWEESFGRSLHRREDNIKADLKETKWKEVDWFFLARGHDL